MMDSNVMCPFSPSLKHNFYLILLVLLSFWFWATLQVSGFPVLVWGLDLLMFVANQQFDDSVSEYQ